MNAIAGNMVAGRALYVYGLAAEDSAHLRAALVDVAGSTQSPIEIVDVSGRAIIAARHDGAQILRTRRRMLAHARVLEAAMAVCPVLPMRFGHLADDETTLLRLVQASGAAIDTQFDRIGSRVEIGLRISYPREAALAALLAETPGIAAERDRLNGAGPEAHFQRISLGRTVAEHLDRRRSAAQSQIVRALSGLCPDYVLKAPDDDVEVLRAECLTERGSVDALVDHVLAAARKSGFAAAAEPHLHLVGPAPPFHFVDLALAPGKETA